MTQRDDTRGGETNGDQVKLIPKRPAPDDLERDDPRAWPDQRELEVAEDFIPIAERGR